VVILRCRVFQTHVVSGIMDPLPPRGKLIVPNVIMGRND
jgi:hypothetical protein